MNMEAVELNVLHIQYVTSLSWQHKSRSVDDCSMQQAPWKQNKKSTFYDETSTTFPIAKLICGYTGIRPSIGPGHVAYLKAPILQEKHSKKKIYNGRLFEMHKS